MRKRGKSRRRARAEITLLHSAAFPFRFKRPKAFSVRYFSTAFCTRGIAHLVSLNCGLVVASYFLDLAWPEEIWCGRSSCCCCRCPSCCSCCCSSYPFNLGGRFQDFLSKFLFSSCCCQFLFLFLTLLC